MNGGGYHHHPHYHYWYLPSHPDIGSEFPNTLCKVEETFKTLVVFLAIPMQYIPIHSFILSFILAFTD